MALNKTNIVVPAGARPAGSPLASIGHIIAVGSGKGGVGKSTVAVNLAVALSELGARVGLLDADIYGPSVPQMLGADKMPTQTDENSKIVPPIACGVKMMSMGHLGQETPVIWRGPMASRAVSQFLSEVDWGPLDYLLIDLPPGTGDIQLTLAQSARLSGAIIVMTPQVLATQIAKKGLKMFEQVRVPVLGLVENMGEHECPKCGHLSHIFSEGGAARVGEELGLPVLAQLPLDPILVSGSDSGEPVVRSRPDSPVAKKFIELAQNMAAELSSVLSGTRESKLQVSAFEPHAESGMVKIIWSDGIQSAISSRELRYLCPCANCVDENTGRRKITRESVPEKIKIAKAQTVGNYALSLQFSDGHNSGIYSYEYLAKLVRDKKQ